MEVSNPTAAESAATASWGEDLGCAVLGIWLVSGVYLDGWAHLHRDGLETFFTPWHAVLYSGFAALAGWLAAVALRRRRPNEPARRWIPPGYGLGLVGVAVFLAGGLADMTWHQIFGIEVGLEALLSPTHLVLLVGGVLMLTTPLRAAAARQSVLPTGGAGLPVVLATAVTAALAAFFLSYLSVFTDTAALTAPTRIPEGAPGHRGAENVTIVGLGEYLTTTAVLVVAVLFGYRRTRQLPTGLITGVVAAVVLGAGVLTEFAHPAALVGAIVGGLGADAVVRAVAARAPHLTAVTVGAALPGLVWPGHLAGLAVSTGVAWNIELWAGIMILTALGGAVLGSLTCSPPELRRPADARGVRQRSDPSRRAA